MQITPVKNIHVGRLRPKQDITYHCKCGRIYARQPSLYSHVRLRHADDKKYILNRKERKNKCQDVSDKISAMKNNIEAISKEVGVIVDKFKMINADVQPNNVDPVPIPVEDKDSFQVFSKRIIHNISVDCDLVFRMRSDPSNQEFLSRVHDVFKSQQHQWNDDIYSHAQCIPDAMDYFYRLVDENNVKLTGFNGHIRRVVDHLRQQQYAFSPCDAIVYAKNLLEYLASRIKGKPLSDNSVLIRFANIEFDHVYTKSIRNLFC